ncbi:MAG: hypothetical protein ABJZ55_11220 [Fuerstiella sp.]
MSTATPTETAVDFRDVLPPPSAVRDLNKRPDPNEHESNQPVPSVGLLDKIRESDLASSLLAIFDQAMISGTNFLTAVLIGRCCGAESLGIYSLVAAALAMTIGLQDQLITAPFVLYQNRFRPNRLKQYTGSVFAHQTVLTGIIFAIFAGICQQISHSGGLPSTISWILLLSAPSILYRAFVRNLALARCDVISVVALDALVCVCQLGVVGSLAWTGHLALPVVYVTMGFTCTTAALVWLQKHRADFKFSRRAIKADAVRNWRFGRWALATHLAGTSTPYIMPWILFSIHGEAATGTLAACSVIVGVANIMLAGMGDFLAPRAAAAFAQGGKNQLTAILMKMLILISIGIGTVCAVAFGVGEQVIQILYDGRFPEAGQLVGLLTLSVLANALGALAGNGLWAIDRPRANFIADITTLIIAIVCAALLVQPYAAFGAASATLLASAGGAVVRFVIFRNQLAKR